MPNKILQFQSRAAKDAPPFEAVELSLDPKKEAESWAAAYQSVQLTARLLRFDPAKLAEALVKLRDDAAFRELLENFSSHLDYLRAVVGLMGSVEARLCVTIDQIEGK